MQRQKLLFAIIFIWSILLFILLNRQHRGFLVWILDFSRYLPFIGIKRRKFSSSRISMQRILFGGIVCIFLVFLIQIVSYSPDCIVCREYEPTWIQANKEFSKISKLRLARVDITTETGILTHTM